MQLQPDRRHDDRARRAPGSSNFAYTGIGSINTYASTATSLFGGFTYLWNYTTAFNVASGTAPGGVDLLVTATLADPYPNAGFGIQKTGLGKMVLACSTAYTGTTTVSAGILQIATPASLYNATAGSWTAANIIVNSGATLAVNVGGTNDFQPADVTNLLSGIDSAVNNNGLRNGSSIGFDTTNATSPVTLSNIIANTTGPGGGAVGLAKLRNGALILSGSNTYTGGTTVAGGALEIGNGGSGEYLTSLSIAMSNNATVEFNHADTYGAGGLQRHDQRQRAVCEGGKRLADPERQQLLHRPDDDLRGDVGARRQSTCRRRRP